jgi:hypothetical protein
VCLLAGEGDQIRRRQFAGSTTRGLVSPRYKRSPFISLFNEIVMVLREVMITQCTDRAKQELAVGVLSEDR